MAYSTCIKCKRLIGLGNSYCENHSPITPRRQGTTTGRHEKSATQRGYNEVWKRNRAKAIRDQPYCSYCGTTQDLTGDHIIPLSKGGTNDPANIQVLCRGCNARRGNNPAKRLARRVTRITQP